MLLTTFLALNAFGAGLWLLGHIFGYHGISSIGAVIILMVGGAAAVTSVEVQTGETIERQFTTVDNDTVENNTTVSYETQPVAVTESLGSVQSYLLGALTMIAAALLLVQDLNRVGD